MKRIGATGWNNAAWLLALALLGGACAPALSAGERILLPNDKAKTAPVHEKSAPSDPFKDWTKAGERNPLLDLDLVMPPVRPLDPKEQKRLKNARAEKENWMILDPGELQQKDDEKNLLGVHDYSLDDLEKGDAGENYTFYNLKIGRPKSAEGSRPNLLRLPGQRPNRNAGAEAAQANQQRLAEELEDTEKRGPRSSLSIMGRDGSTEAGAHLSRELNLKDLLDTSQTGPGSRSEATLYDFLRANSGAGLTREQQARRDNFKALLDGPSQAQAQDPINYRSDLFQERMSPILPRPTIETPGGNLGSLPAPGAGLGGGLSRPQGFGLPDPSAPRLPMPGPSLPSPYLSPNDPWRASQAQPGPAGGSLFNREGPRRGGI